MEKGGKYEIDMTKIDQECYLCRRFSPQPLVRDAWFWVPFNLSFKEGHFDV